MNEAETRAELIDPKLKDSGWGSIESAKVLREHHITIGKIQTGGLGDVQVHHGLGDVAQFISLYRQEGNPREYPLKNK